jgi:hypothetical protein
LIATYFYRLRGKAFIMNALAFDRDLRGLRPPGRSQSVAFTIWPLTGPSVSSAPARLRSVMITPIPINIRTQWPGLRNRSGNSKIIEPVSGSGWTSLKKNNFHGLDILYRVHFYDFIKLAL